MLRRRTPLRRTSFRRSSRKSKYRRRLRDLDYLRFVKKLACCARHLGKCAGPVEADHIGPRGLSQKSDDRLVISLCQKHHRERTDFSGDFRAFDQRSMREFIARALVATQIAARELGVIDLPAA